MVLMHHRECNTPDPCTSLGVLAYAMSIVSFAVQMVLPLGYTAFEEFIVPMAPWMLCIILLVKVRTKHLRAYWWVLPSAIPAMFEVFYIALLMLAWSIGGFV